MFKKIQWVLAVLLIGGAYGSSPAVVEPVLTKEALFDPSIPAETLVRQIEGSGRKVTDAVVNAIRMTPGEHFKAVGKIDSFDFDPVAYDQRHAVIYYIPKSLEADLYGKSPDVAPVLVIWHGGGESTDTYEASKATAEMYLTDFVPFAEESRTILIAPSTALGWNAHACSFLTREVNALARKELNVSGNRFYLFGHSMGAMGMTRATSNLADEFAGFLATAGGMEDYARTEGNLRPYFNTRFTHINGENDHFVEFKPRLIATQKKLQEMAKKLRTPLNFKALFHRGGHDYDLPMTEMELMELFKHPRNLLQTKLYAYMGRGLLPEGLPKLLNFSYPHFFWAKAKEMTDPRVAKTSVYSHWDFQIDRPTNAIVMSNFSGPENLKSVELFVSGSLLDLFQPVKVRIGSSTVLETKIQPDPVKTIELVRSRGDAQFVFDNVVEVKVPVPAKKKRTR